MKTTTYILPDFWASALINDDYTGMEDSDIAAMEKWIDDCKPGYCIGVSESPEFTQWHDARGYVLACDCLEFTFN